MKVRFLASILMFCITFGGHAQPLEKCLNHGYSSLFPEREEHYKQQFKSLFSATYRVAHQTDTGGIITIPVVFHIIHLESDSVEGQGSNLGTSQIQSQIRVLNEDFRRMFGTPGYNDNPIGADVEIEFCLAGYDPFGNPSNGITRDATTQTFFKARDDDALIKAYSPWPPSKYLNIWVVPSFSGGVLGYASFPWEAEDEPELDGIAVQHRFVGDEGTTDFPSNKYNLGRTITHEAGHWLGLRHIWADIANCTAHDLPDSIDDTPTALTSHFGCQIGAVSCGSEDMVENYMDYSDDSCFNTFTQGQKKLMRYVLTSGAYPLKSVMIGQPALCAESPQPPKPTPRIFPGSGFRSFTVTGLLPGEEMECSLYSMVGKRQISFRKKADLGGLLRLNMEGMHPGLAILDLKGSMGSSLTQKIFIEW